MIKNTFYILIFWLFSITSSLAGDSLTSNTSTDMMINIKFIPKEFHDVEFGLAGGDRYPCSPGYPDTYFESSNIHINIPKQIIYKRINNLNTPVIPLCAVFAISEKRALKYNYLSTKVVHIRRVDQDRVYSGKLIDRWLASQHLVPHPREREENRRLKQRVQEAQKYSDDELDGGRIWAYPLNINILEYINIPFSSGRYEIYLSAFNIESNKATVEIIVEE